MRNDHPFMNSKIFLIIILVAYKRLVIARGGAGGVVLLNFYFVLTFTKFLEFKVAL